MYVLEKIGVRQTANDTDIVDMKHLALPYDACLVCAEDV